jgi:thiol:disulfide interchange protein
MQCAIALSFLLLLAPSQIAESQVYQGRELVKAELLADTATVVPGKSFRVGVLLRMVPHWHTYWTFSGDAGLPTEIKWQLPSGWKVGEVQWPTPVKLQDPGDIETYGYENEVMLTQELTPPQSLGKDSVKLSAQVNWLVCERLCIPGSADLTLSLPISASGQSANAELFTRYEKLLPLASPPSGLSIRQAAGPKEKSVTITGHELERFAEVDFYPLADAKTIVGHPRISRHDTSVTITVPFETEPPAELRGLVVLSQSANAGNRTAWYLGRGQPEASTIAVVESAPVRGLWTFLFFGFVGGFILNLMPCVLPVISLKIFGFIQHAGQDRRRILRSGVAFVLGIFVWFLGLAAILVALKAAGHQITWAAQFTNPYFVILLSAVVLVFALDLFGVFEIILPQAVMHRMIHSAGREGEVGSFFQGLFATALATPCTAPFLGAALGFAFTQSGLIILTMFFAVAAGMSTPYLLLSAQPTWLRFLPKPGPWMEHLKQFMGFLLLATLLFLLYVIGAQRGYEALIWTTCFLLVLSLACWIKGRFAIPAATVRSRVVALILVSLLVLGGGLYFIGIKFPRASPSSSGVAMSGGWQAFSPDRLRSELDQDHAIFVDFTAAWCITCKFNEATVLESTQVREAFQQHGVIKLKADWTNGDPVITKLLQQFGRPGVPLYVLYPGKSGPPIVFPEVLTKSLLLDKLQSISHQIAAE